jgi:hypothetical protein
MIRPAIFNGSDQKERGAIRSSKTPSWTRAGEEAQLVRVGTRSVFSRDALEPTATIFVVTVKSRSRIENDDGL